jgi:hypothetical protein
MKNKGEFWSEWGEKQQSLKEEGKDKYKRKSEEGLRVDKYRRNIE